MLEYSELETRSNDDGPAWIGRVRLSRSGRTVSFHGRALGQGGLGDGGNGAESEPGELDRDSGIGRHGGDRHGAGCGQVTIEAAAVEEYLARVGESQLDKSRVVISHDLLPADPSRSVNIENEPLQGESPRPRGPRSSLARDSGRAHPEELATEDSRLDRPV